jgi:hypothetical protein
MKRSKRKKDGMRASLISWGALGALGALVAAAPALGIVLDQLDDFEDETVEDWAGGGGSGLPLPPVNIPNGGPDGPEDAYLQISAVNENLGTRNGVQWTGNYTAAEVVKLHFHLNNTGLVPLALRISLFGPGGTFTTTNETVLPPGIGWASVIFDLDAGSLTWTGGGTGNLATTLADVTTLLIRHDPDGPVPPDGPSPSGSPNPVTGTLGIDNIRALPEPSSTALLAAGVVALALTRSARGRSRGAR